MLAVRELADRERWYSSCSGSCEAAPGLAPLAVEPAEVVDATALKDTTGALLRGEALMLPPSEAGVLSYPAPMTSATLGRSSPLLAVWEASAWGSFISPSAAAVAVAVAAVLVAPAWKVERPRREGLISACCAAAAYVGIKVRLPESVRAKTVGAVVGSFAGACRRVGACRVGWGGR